MEKTEDFSLSYHGNRYGDDEEARKQAKRNTYMRWYYAHKKDHNGHQRKYYSKKKQTLINEKETLIELRKQIVSLEQLTDDLTDENEKLTISLMKLLAIVTDAKTQKNEDYSN